MIFATDLDRTLIYAERFLASYEKEAINIEIFKEKPISYISAKALALLKELDKVATVIPITTRNREQYERISIWGEHIKPRIYVVNNGGTIFIEGKEDPIWTEKIKKQLSELTLSYEEALRLFLSLYKGPVERYKKSDELIWVVLSDKNQIDWEAVKNFQRHVEEHGWKIDVTGRKIYLYPACISKWKALHYIKMNYLDEEVVAAGDSLFDAEMIHRAEFGVVPKGSVIEADCEENIYRTNQAGLGAAEDILSYALEKVYALKDASKEA